MSTIKKLLNEKKLILYNSFEIFSNIKFEKNLNNNNKILWLLKKNNLIFDKIVKITNKRLKIKNLKNDKRKNEITIDTNMLRIVKLSILFL